LLGRGRSEWVRFLAFCLACVLVAVNMFCTVLAGCSMG
jgi:hypothetical protein